MRGFVNEVRANLGLPVTLAAWAFLTVMMALAGPFGSYEEVPLIRRLLFWLVVTALALVLAVAVRVLVYSRLGLSGLWRGGVLTALLVATVLTWPVHRLMDLRSDLYPLLPPQPGELAVFIFCLTMGFCALRHAMGDGSLGPAVVGFAGGPVALPGHRPHPRLLDRLAPDLRGRVLRVSGRDHYVDVVTDAGSASLLMRFSDALAELEGAKGLRVHRSHWVADPAVIAVEREGARVFLRLTLGDPVPVSRTYLAEVEGRGWPGQA